MSDRAAEMGHEGATVCPFVAFQDHRERRATDPDHRHRCYAEPLPAPRAIAHQRRYCLSPEFPSCPIFQDWAIRAAAAGVSMPSARRVSGRPAPIAPVAIGSNGSAKRTPDWAAPPPWVAATSEADAAAGGSARGQLTAFDDKGLEDDIDDDALAAAAMAAADPTGTSRPIRSAPIAEAPRAPRPAPIAGAPRAPRPAPRTPRMPLAGAAGGGGTDADRPRTGRGFAYDLIAGDPAFPDPGDEEDVLEDVESDEARVDEEALDDLGAGQPVWATRPAGAAATPLRARSRGAPIADEEEEEGFEPPAAAGAGHTSVPPEHEPSMPRPMRPASSRGVDALDAADAARAARGGPALAFEPPTTTRGTARASGPAGLPPPDYLPPARQMATPIARSSRTGPFEGERDWEKPKRFEAYPTLRTRVGGVGMPGVPRFGRLPPVAIALLALVLAAGILFALPGIFAGGLFGGGGASPSPSASVRPSVSIAPTPTPEPTPEVYIVKKGDTFSGIATKHGLTIQELKDANPQIKDISRIQIGDRINIPDPFASPSADTGVGEPTASPTG